KPQQSGVGHGEGPAPRAEPGLRRDSVVVTLVVVVATREIARLDDLRVVIAAAEHGSGEGRDVDRLALLVDDLRLRQGHRDRLRSGDLADHRGDLARVAERLDELARLHAVLRRGLHEVGVELVLAALTTSGPAYRAQSLRTFERL